MTAPRSIGAHLDGVCLALIGVASRPSVWWCALAVLSATLVVPLLLVDVPPLLDYPNHLARMYVLAHVATDPILARMYAPHWAIIPNLALDLLVPPLLKIMPLHVAGRIAVAAAILLPTWGSISVSRAVFGVRSYWSLLAGFVAYNVTLRLGFLNFLIGAGIALFATAAWAAWRETRPQLAVGLAAMGGVATFFCHIMAPAFMLLLLGCHEIPVVFAARAGRHLTAVMLLRRGAALAAVAAAPAALFAASPFSGTWTEITWQSTESKVYGALGPFLCDSLGWDELSAAACLVFVYLCVRARHGEIRPWLGLAAVVLAACYVAAPFTLKGSSFFCTRFPVMFGFLLFAGFRPTRLSPRTATLATAVFVGLFVARMASISAIWWEHNDDLAQIRQVIAPVEPGSRVLVFGIPYAEAPAWWLTTPPGRYIAFTMQADLHEAALLLIERRAFWPELFASPDQQPLIVLPPYRDLASSQGFMPIRAMLDRPIPPIAMTFQVPQDWRRQYDYVLLLDAGGEPDLKRWAGDRMDLLRATDAAALFRVRRPPE